MSIARSLPILLLALTAAVPAFAGRDCPNFYPAANTAIPKDGGGTRYVCEYLPNINRYTCTQTSGSHLQEMVAVSGYDGASNDKISVWGTDGATGAKFCYTRTHTGADPVEVLRLLGASGSDTISLRDGNDHLKQPATVVIGSTLTLRAQVDGDAGDDIINGSEETGSQYSETLRGGPGDDTIYGNDGDDVIYGCGPTATCSSPDEDTLNGNEGEDDIFCDQNACTAKGGDGEDAILGSDEIDTILGGDQNDIICGEGGGDTLKGGGGVDKIWGGLGVDNMTGGPDVDLCISPVGDCENPLPAGSTCEL